MGDLRHMTVGDLEDFRDESKRLCSFANWPRSAGAQPAALSRAGFFYTGERQKAACAFCRVVIEDWSFADQAISKHRERSPNCPFVLRAYDATDGQRPTMAAGGSSPSCVLWESERRKTFEGWPVTFVSPEDLARAGFVYLKHADRVQCVFCNGVVGAWEEGDVPLIEHQRHFKTCPFVLRRADVGNVSIEDEYRGHRAPPPPLLYSAASSDSTTRGHDVTGGRVPVPGFRPERNGAPMAVTRMKTPLTNGELNILPHSPAKNPNYKNKEVRLTTFADWPACVRQEPEALAEAGFFYTGMSDHVKCFHCNGGLRNWEPKDIPWEEHARWFPNCEYISLNKGKDFIETAHLNRPPTLDPAASASVVVNGTSANQASLEVSEAEIDELMRSEVARQALDLNLEAHQIRNAMRRRMIHAGYPFVDAQSLANAVLDLEKAQQCQGSSSEGAPVVRRSVSLVELPVTGSKNTTNNVTAPRSGTVGKRSAKEMDVDPKQCKICWDKEVCVVFLPCGHLVSCAECSSALKDCPFCRQEIKGTVRTYWT